MPAAVTSFTHGTGPRNRARTIHVASNGRLNHVVLLSRQRGRADPTDEPRPIRRHGTSRRLHAVFLSAPSGGTVSTPHGEHEVMGKAAVEVRPRT